MIRQTRLALAALLAIPMIVFAGEPSAQDASKSESSEAQLEPESSVTHHDVRIAGQVVKYTATVGWLIMKDDKGEPVARFGYTAYTRDGKRDPAERPILFAFNGGPGSSSVWLHMGILGPRRIVVADAGRTAPPPGRYVDNEFSVLDATDIVMLDPVGTGFSKPLGKAKGKDFWGVDQDIKSVGAFIKRYVSENGRWASPKYLLGESYGGMRAAGVVHYLQTSHGMNFNGVVLVSPFLSFGPGVDGASVDLPYVLFLPTLAATAWYHDAIPDKPPSLEAFVEEVSRFAYDEYAPALMQGYVIAAADKRRIAEKLAGYTGTSADYWEKADLRVTHMQFLQELKRNERLIAGRIDSRYLGPALDPLSESMDYDPFFPAVGPTFTAALLDYLNRELDFGRDEEYRVSNFSIEWDWSHQLPNLPDSSGLSPDTAPDLAVAMTMNPALNVLVQQGWYDLATPYLATMYAIDHLDIAESARKRIRIEHYAAGHMMYVHDPSMTRYRDDLVGFIRDTDRL
jgi:carboxypeptidase C (cathepsin A)